MSCWESAWAGAWRERDGGWPHYIAKVAMAYSIPPWELRQRCSYVDLARMYASLQAESEYAMNYSS